MNNKILKNKDFFILISAGLISKLGTSIQGFALSLYILKLTGSGTKFASVLAITFIPELLLGPLMGVFADWFDRKKMIIVLDLLSGITVALAALLYTVNNGLSLWQIYILVIILTIISLLYDPAIGTVLPSIVAKDELMSANSIKSFTNSLATFLSPVLAGIIFGMHGLFIVFIINSISFFLAAGGEFFINIPKLENEKKSFSISSYLADLSDGFKFVVNQKVVLSIALISLITNFTLVPIAGIVLPFIIKVIFKNSDFQYGLFQSMFMSGLLIGPVVSGIISKKASLNKIVFSTIFLLGIFTGGIAFVASSAYIYLFKSILVPYISLIVLSVIIALVTSICNISLATIFQQTVPIDMMGRIGAFMSTIVMAAVPLGQMLFGLMVDKLPIFLSMSLASILIICSSFIFKKLSYKNSNVKAINMIEEI